MIFPSEAVETARRELAEKLEDAAIEPATAFEELLTIDPDNRVALFELSRIRQEAGDVAGAERFGRRGLAAHPCDYRFYVQLSGLLAAQPEGDVDVAAGLMELGTVKLLGDPDALEDAERLRAMGKLPACADFSDRTGLEALVASLAERRERESPAATAELEALRLIHDLQETLGNQMDREVVEAILRHGEACRPLLTGVLRALVEGYLPEGGELMGEAALALLGEIGDPRSLADLVPFSTVEDKTLSDIASWALLRVASRRPGDTLQAIRDFDRRTSGGERACMAEVIATMPETQGKAEALNALLDRFQAVAEAERSDTFVVISAALLTVMGKGASPAIRQNLQRTAGLPDTVQKEVNDLLKAFAADPDAFSFPPEEEVPTVYGICCADRIDAYEDDAEKTGEEHVHGPGCDHDHDHGAGLAARMPARNDPCWCGSGKKYKKCHLEEDEAQRKA